MSGLYINSGGGERFVCIMDDILFEIRFYFVDGVNKRITIFSL